MRIISNFHDYYDTVQVYGLDKSILFIRKEKELKDKNTIDKCSEISDCFEIFNISTQRVITNGFGIVVVCGKIYPYINFVKYFKSYPWRIEKEFRFYDKESVFNFIKNCEPVDKKLKNKIDKVFEHAGKEYKNSVSLHFDLKTPIIHILCGGYTDKVVLKVVLNANLKPLSFQKVMDPFTIFQELSMFISGIMGGKSPPMIQLKDEDRIAKHGFDKWSFRKMPDS